MSNGEDNRNGSPIRIDVGAVIKSRLGAKSEWVPTWFVRRIERLICQDKLNEMLEVAYPERGSRFCRAVLDHLKVNVGAEGCANLPPQNHSRVIFVSNHPLGSLDGMALIDFVAQYFGREPRFVVNDLLMAVEPLRDVFLPINKHGSQSREAISGIDQAMASDTPIIIFPAGLCSRRHNGRVADLEWKKMFVQKAREFKRDIVPLYFMAENSPTFYRTALWRERLGIGFNIEMMLLPSEIFKAEGKTFKICVGEPIEWRTLSTDLHGETQRIRNIVDMLKR